MPQQCEVGAEPHELGRDRNGYRRCIHCGTTAQTITSGYRSAVKGDFRVVCDGPEGNGVCPIGPSEPTPHPTSALAALEDHREKVSETEDGPHRLQIIKL